jgi:hypothetical protein
VRRRLRRQLPSPTYAATGPSDRPGASVLVAHLYPLVAHHDASTSILLGAADEPLLVHALTMAEVQFGGVKVGRGGPRGRRKRPRICSARHLNDGAQTADMRSRTRLTLLVTPPAHRSGGPSEAGGGASMTVSNGTPELCGWQVSTVATRWARSSTATLSLLV